MGGNSIFSGTVFGPSREKKTMKKKKSSLYSSIGVQTKIHTWHKKIIISV